ncbi:MAG: hypothetical protein Kow0062_25820 [Acidobacteriota bacterium]
MPLVLSWLPLSPAGHAYLGLVLGVMAGTVGIPIPEEVPLLTAGVLAALGVIDLRIAIAVGIVTCFVGDLAVFATGRRIGFHLEGHPRIARVVRGRGFRRARRLYVDHGPWTLFIARMLPGVKTPFLFTAGAMRMPWRRFLAFDLGSVLVLVPTLVLVGYHSSWSLAQLTRVIGEVGLLAAALFVLALGGVIAAYAIRRRRRLARLRARRAAATGVIAPPAEVWSGATGRADAGDAADAPARAARRSR